MRSLLASSNQFDNDGKPIKSPTVVEAIALGNNSQYGNFVFAINNISDNGTIDFQLQAYIGYDVQIDENITDPAALAFHHMEPFYSTALLGNQAAGVVHKL